MKIFAERIQLLPRKKRQSCKKGEAFLRWERSFDRRKKQNQLDEYETSMLEEQTEQQLKKGMKELINVCGL